jgi:hypothetical protein
MNAGLQKEAITGLQQEDTQPPGIKNAMKQGSHIQHGQMRSTQKEHEEIMPYVSGDFPFIHVPPSIHEEQASEEARHTVRGHLKNVEHETSGLETIGRGCQGSKVRHKQKENTSLESLHSADLKKRSGRLLFWRRASKP